jgi:hypothetical protein
MPTVRFRIGDAFPADDVLARFVTTLALIANDLLRSTTMLREHLDDDADSRGYRLMFFRYEVSLFHEVAEFIGTARKRFPEIETFVNALPQDAVEAATAIAAHAQELAWWLPDHRNRTFHYPEMHPKRIKAGEDEVMQALAAAAEEEGTIAGVDEVATIRFGFADEIAVQWLPVERLGDAVTSLREAVLSVPLLATRAVEAYIMLRPDGTFAIEW